MKKRHVIKLAPWVEQAVAEWCRDNRMSFQQAVSYLLECELNGRGYLRKDFEPGIVDYPLDE
jgi:hypothetical protein